MTNHRRELSAQPALQVISPLTTSRWRDFVLSQAQSVQAWSGGWVRRTAPVRVRLARITRNPRGLA